MARTMMGLCALLLLSTAFVACKKKGPPTPEEYAAMSPEDRAEVYNEVTAAASLATRNMLDDAAAYFDEHGSLPPQALRTPNEVPCMAEAVDPGEWDKPGWEAIGIPVEGETRMSYEISRGPEPDTARFTVYADLDCDGDYSSFTRTLQVVDGDLSLGIPASWENQAE